MVKLTAHLWPSTLVSQIINTLLTTTHMGKENNQENGKSPMHTLPLPTPEHAQQQKKGVPSRQNHLHPSPCLSHCPAPCPFSPLCPSPRLCPFPCLRPFPCP